MTLRISWQLEGSENIPMADEDPIPKEEAPATAVPPQAQATESQQEAQAGTPSPAPVEGMEQAPAQAEPGEAPGSPPGLEPELEASSPSSQAAECPRPQPGTPETGGGGPIGIVAFLAVLCALAPWVAASAGPEPAAICVTVGVLCLLFTGLAAWVFARQATRRRDGFVLAALRQLASGSPFGLDERDPLSAGFAEVASAFEERLRSAMIAQESQLKKAANTDLVRARSQCEGLVEKYAERTHREKKDAEAALEAFRLERERESKARDLEREQHSRDIKTLKERLVEAQAKLSEMEEELRREKEQHLRAQTSLRDAESKSASGQVEARDFQEKLSLRSSECERLAADKETVQAEVARLQAEVSRLGGQSVRFFDKVAAQLRGPLQIIDNLVARLGPPEKPGKAVTLPQQRHESEAPTETVAPAGGVAEIRSRLAQLSRLVENILDLCRLQSSQLSMVYSETDVVQLVRRMAADFQAKAKAKDVQVSTALPARMPPVVTDARYAARILGELLSNAVRFTPRWGKVSVKARLVQEGAQGGAGDARPQAHLQVEVSDTGPGIAAAHQERIFAAFERGLDPQFTLSDAGAGLGLTLARQFARMLGGRISVESKEGHGSTFTVSLPVKVGGAVPAY